MMEIEIEVIETLSRVVKVDADSIADAIMQVEDMYKNEEIVLDYIDFDGNVSIQPIIS